jgi:hypothetical protein
MATQRATSKVYSYPLHDIEKQSAWICFREVFWETPTNADGSTANTLELKRVLGDSVYLYLPGAPALTESANWEGENLGTTGAFLKGVLPGALDPQTDMGNKLGKVAIQSLADIASALTGQAGTDKATLAKVLQQTRTDGTGIGAGIRSALRTTANPHLKALFNGVNLRNFSFTFEFHPETEQEAVEVDNIIRFFRRNLYPETVAPLLADEIADGDERVQEVFDALAYKFPNSLEVQMCYSKRFTDSDGNVSFVLMDKRPDGSIFGHKFKDTHLKSVATTYDSGTAMTLRPDARFLSSTLAIELEEEETLSKADIVDGGF